VTLLGVDWREPQATIDGYLAIRGDIRTSGTPTAGSRRSTV
jgi:hypothetical protein